MIDQSSLPSLYKQRRSDSIISIMSSSPTSEVSQSAKFGPLLRTHYTMASSSTSSSLLTLPTEIRQHIIEYTLDDYEQFLSFCDCRSHKRTCLTQRRSIRRKRQPAGDANLQLILVNKTLAAETLNVKSERFFLITCSASSLRIALTLYKADPLDTLRNIVIVRRLPRPVDVCDINYDLLHGTARTWLRKLCVACYSILWEVGYSVDILKTVAESSCTLEKERSMTNQHLAFRVSWASTKANAKAQTWNSLSVTGEKTTPAPCTYMGTY